MKPGNIGKGSTPRLQQMDGLRGIAMLFVFMGHFAPLWNGIAPAGTAGFFLKLVEADATLGSSFFMLLSGFFSYGSLVRGEKRFAEFMRGRLWRLYPLYLVMILVYVAGSILIPRLSKLPSDPREATLFLLETLFLLPGFLRTHPILIDVSWMLSFVVLFYFIEAALARISHGVFPQRRFRLDGLLRECLIGIAKKSRPFRACAGDQSCRVSGRESA